MPKTSQQVVRDLEGRLEGRIAGDTITRTLYSTDASIFHIRPLAVAEPATSEDLRRLVLYCREEGIPLAPRGAGSGLAGESLTSGIVIDCSRNLNRLLDISPDGALIRVQPGLVHGTLNSELQKRGRIFGPDPATSDRCTLGGMIANNSTGAHSLRYGMTSSWVRSLKIMLDDGSELTTGRFRLDSPAFQKLLSSGSREGRIYSELLRLLTENQRLIADTWPAAPRNRHGYLLKHILQDGVFDPAPLFCASEGTLGLILEAELATAQLPAATALLSLSFNSLADAARATVPLLASNPAAIEIIDDVCLGMARSIKEYAALYPPGVKAVLLVEFDGSCADEAAAAAEHARRAVAGIAAGIQQCRDAPEKRLVWSMRKHISGMINRVPGKMQPAAIIEDASVPPGRLAEYLAGVEKILCNYGLRFLCFGHAGDGTVHIRPFIDRRDPRLGAFLPELCIQVYDLTLRLGGSISGEHGDGLLRAPFIRQQYGELFDVFVKIKRLFDPQGILNPGKKTDCSTETWQRRMRYSLPKEPPGGWLSEAAATAEACNGCAACRVQTAEGDMCPLFRALKIEAAAPRAKAGVVQALLYGRLADAGLKELRSFSELCLNCKACARECPAGVKAGDLMAAVRGLAAESGLPLRTRIISRLEDLLACGALSPHLSNCCAALAPLQKALLSLLGLTTRRPFPAFAAQPFLRRAQRNGSGDQIVYFVDTYANLLQPQIAEALVAILEHNGFKVIIPPQRASGVVAFNNGNLRHVRAVAQYNAAQLAPYAEQGLPIICSEPSAALMLREEYLLLDRSPAVRAVAEQCQDALSFLAGLLETGRLKGGLRPVPLTIAYHLPCHQKALGPGNPALTLLQIVPELQVKNLGARCCGMSGTFGLKERHYRTSMAIGTPLFERLRQSGADFGMTECSSCRMQMEHGAPETRTLHPLTVLAAAYGLQPLPSAL